MLPGDLPQLGAGIISFLVTGQIVKLSVRSSLSCEKDIAKWIANFTSKVNICARGLATSECRLRLVRTLKFSVVSFELESCMSLINISIL